VRLVIQIQAVADQLVEVDILRKIEAPAAWTRTAVTPVAASLSARTPFALPAFGTAFAALFRLSAFARGRTFAALAAGLAALARGPAAFAWRSRLTLRSRFTL
jgi:hypothetical protein